MNNRPRPAITVRNTGTTYPASGAQSLLVTLQMHEVPIQTLCGGHAGCGKCVILVHRGAARLSPKTAAEEKRLAAIDAEPNMRLACQSYPGGEIEIEVINDLKRS